MLATTRQVDREAIADRMVTDAGLNGMTMLDVHRALGENRIFALGPADPTPTCLVEQAVNGSLESALHEAELLLLRRLADVSLADIAADFDERMTQLSAEQISA